MASEATLLRAVKAARKRFKGYQGVKGIAIGVKDGGPCIVVTVGRKLPLELISRDQRIPRKYKRCRVRVIERKEPLKFVQVKPGDDAAHRDVTCCTDGGRLWSKDLNRWIQNGNNHCFAQLNRAQIRDPIIAPCKSHGGSAPDNTVSFLSDFEELRPEGQFQDCGGNFFCRLLQGFCSIFPFGSFDFSFPFCERDRQTNAMDHAVASLVDQTPVLEFPTGGYPTRVARPKVGDVSLRDSWQGGALPDGHDWKAEVLEIEGEWRIDAGEFGFFWIAGFLMGQGTVGDTQINQGAIGGQSGSAVRSLDGLEWWGWLNAGSTEVAIAYYGDAVVQRFNLSLEEK